MTASTNNLTYARDRMITSGSTGAGVGEAVTWAGLRQESVLPSPHVVETQGAPGPHPTGLPKQTLGW
jgi:hypothetical protein